MRTLQKLIKKLSIPKSKGEWRNIHSYAIVGWSKDLIDLFDWDLKCEDGILFAIVEGGKGMVPREDVVDVSEEETLTSFELVKAVKDAVIP
jgi:hypothetical protein